MDSALTNKSGPGGETQSRPDASKEHETKSLGRSTRKILIGASTIMIVLGLVLWFVQVSNGLYTYNAQYPWGPLVAAFFTAVALGTGSLIIAAAMQIAGKIDSAQMRMAYRMGFAFLLTASIIIIADVGNPMQFVWLIATSNPLSPMVFDFWFMAIALITCLVGCFASKPNKAIAIITSLACIGLLFSEAWVLTSGSSRELWTTTMGAGETFVQVALAGSCALVLAWRESDSSPADLAIALCRGAAALNLLIVLFDLIVGLASGGQLSGTWAALAVSPLFWTGLIICAVVPFALTSKNGSTVAKTSLVALTGVGIALLKLSYIWTAESIALLDFLPQGTLEIGACELGMIACFAFVAVLAYELLGMQKGGK